MTHQVVTCTIAKTEFLLGLASLLIGTIGVKPFQHIHEKVTEIWVVLETLRPFLCTAEANAYLDQFDVMCPAWDPLDAARHFYPKTYPRLIEIVQQIGASPRSRSLTELIDFVR
jgi:4-hydroxyphenylacetate 3-monooxygenase